MKIIVSSWLYAWSVCGALLRHLTLGDINILIIPSKLVFRSTQSPPLIPMQIEEAPLGGGTDNLT